MLYLIIIMVGLEAHRSAVFRVNDLCLLRGFSGG